MKQSRNPFQRLWNLSRDAGFPFSLPSTGSNGDPRHAAFLRSLRKDLQLPSNTEVPLEQLEVVVVDLETTGFRADHGDEIISIGAVAVRGSEVLEQECYFSLVNPNRSIPPHIESLTGLSDSELASAPDLVTALSCFFQFVGSRSLVAHHSRHEREFLRSALWKTSRSKFQHRLLDTMLLIHLSAGPLGNATLDTLCAVNGIEIKQRHHALYDALAAAKLWAAYLEKAVRLGYRNLHEVYQGNR
jgi:DNA polymerase-3 subunit epsilon